MSHFSCGPPVALEGEGGRGKEEGESGAVWTLCARGCCASSSPCNEECVNGACVVVGLSALLAVKDWHFHRHWPGGGRAAIINPNRPARIRCMHASARSTHASRPYMRRCQWARTRGCAVQAAACAGCEIRGRRRPRCQFLLGAAPRNPAEEKCVSVLRSYLQSFWRQPAESAACVHLGRAARPACLAAVALYINTP